jgi:hypothetical protein
MDPFGTARPPTRVAFLSHGTQHNTVVYSYTYQRSTGRGRRGSLADCTTPLCSYAQETETLSLTVRGHSCQGPDSGELDVFMERRVCDVVVDEIIAMIGFRGAYPLEVCPDLRVSAVDHTCTWDVDESSGSNIATTPAY